MFKQSITVFQPQKLNISVLNRLSHYNLKLLIRDQPTYHEYKLIHDSFLHIHPDNLSILVKSYPGLINLKTYLNDLSFANKSKFDKLAFEGPLILDGNNHLLANDEASVNRMLGNYDALNSRINLHNLVHPHVAEFADLF